MATLEDLKKEVECLSADDRELLLAHIWELFDRDRDPDYEEAWTSEIERRLSETTQRRGVSSRTWNEIREELAERINRA